MAMNSALQKKKKKKPILIFSHVIVQTLMQLFAKSRILKVKVFMKPQASYATEVYTIVSLTHRASIEIHQTHRTYFSYHVFKFCFMYYEMTK